MDHPRIRGTNSIQLPVTVRPSGSSPHTRDKLKGKNNYGKAFRIIPAYAGQITGLDDDGGSAQDHPRIRGTNRGQEAILFR